MDANLAEGRAPALRSCDESGSCPLAALSANGKPKPCAEISEGHRRKLMLCDALEELADGLPGNIDRLACLRIANDLVPLLRESHRYEEETAFALFEREGAEAATRSVMRLKSEHIQDECAAQDVSDILLNLGCGESVDNPEALGFMLRALFEAMRRHIAFERDHVLPVVTGPCAGSDT